jgi:hypothetical protein
MSHPYVERTLWYEDAKGHASLKQAELRLRSEPLVILGEAGMGKTTLLRWLADAPEFVFTSARKIVNQPLLDWHAGDPRILVIDGLDELSGSRDGDAVDLVLRRLGQLSLPRFVLSCRVADWRSATGADAILELYDQKPLVLHLEPFDDNDTLAYLGQRMSCEAAEAVVEHFTSHGLQGFLGNPQTLFLVSQIVGKERLPSSRAELFERAIDVLRREHNDAKTGAELAREVVLNAAGAAFAALIISGREAIVRRASGLIGDEDIQLNELGVLADRDQLEAALRTRLFRATGVDRFSYWHRSIGEYLAARWLRTVADTPRKRRRLMRLFHGAGLVPSSLRGVHAWLARDPALAQAVITADPVGVGEYGDADDLTADQARAMLDAMSALALENPFFATWHLYSTRGIAHPALLEDLRCLINAHDTPARLRQFLLEAVTGTRVASELSQDLRRLMLNPDADFMNRRAAADALIEPGHEMRMEWSATIQTLQGLDDELSVRLAIDLMDRIGYESFDDELIVNLVIAYGRQRDRTFVVLIALVCHMPVKRIGGVLDCFTQALTIPGTLDNSVDRVEMTELAYGLIDRHARSQEIDVRRLWCWLQRLDTRAEYESGNPDGLAGLLQEDHSLRLDLFRHVLLERSESYSVRSNAWVLNDRCRNIWPTAEDLATLLSSIDPLGCDDRLWRELVQLAHHSPASGARVREAARAFTQGRPDLLSWLDRLAEPPERMAEQPGTDAEHRQAQADQWAEYRAHLLERIDKVRQGDPSTIVNLAMGYLGVFDGVDQANTSTHERIEKWLGQNVSEAASQGFEAFLTSPTLHPSADEIAASMVEGKHWPTAFIIVVALAERHRKGLGFADLCDGPMLAGLFELRYTRLHECAELYELEGALETAIRSRGLWERAIRRCHEPQLQARCVTASLNDLMRNRWDASLATRLAKEWLIRFPDLPVNVEEELIDRLIMSGQYDALRLSAPVGLRSLDDARRRNWLAVSLITDFDRTARIIDSSPEDPELLWHIHGRVEAAQGQPGSKLSPVLLEWLISRFRGPWPVPIHRNGGSGDRNAWHASEHIIHLIRLLGNDPGHDASAALAHLADAPSDSYKEIIRAVAAEQRCVRIESIHTPPDLATIASIARDDLPSSAPDLQGFLVEELAVVQAKIRSDDVESWRGFYNDAGIPYEEERCRDHLLLLLRQGSTEVTFTPEVHVAADKEVDIACSVGNLRLPIEVKGQWHRDLWHAADGQLDRLYANDCRADGYGIYLVLWFGDHVAKNKRIRPPGRGIDCPRTPDELCAMLASTSRAVRDGRIEVVVLDLSPLSVHPKATRENARLK